MYTQLYLTYRQGRVFKNVHILYIKGMYLQNNFFANRKVDKNQKYKIITNTKNITTINAIYFFIFYYFPHPLPIHFIYLSYSPPVVVCSCL
jgi:hypothetical protein